MRFEVLRSDNEAFTPTHLDWPSSGLLAIPSTQQPIISPHQPPTFAAKHLSTRLTHLAVSQTDIWLVGPSPNPPFSSRIEVYTDLCVSSGTLLIHDIDAAKVHDHDYVTWFTAYHLR